MNPLLVPLVGMASVVLIVAIVILARLRDKEVEVERQLYLAQMEHRRKMKDLDRQLDEVSGGNRRGMISHE